MKEEVTYTLRVPRDLWERWKRRVPREMNLNEAIVDLLRNEVSRGE